MYEKGFVSPVVYGAVIVLVVLIGLYQFTKSAPQTTTLQESHNTAPTPQPSALASTSPQVEVTQKPVVTSVTPKPSVKPSATPNITFNSRVKLQSYSPSVVNTGTEVTLAGEGFGTVGGKVMLYGRIVGPCGAFYCLTSVNRWTDTEIKFTMPASPGGEKLEVEVVHNDGTVSNRLSFTLGGGLPMLQDVSPKNAEPLQSVTLSGNDFGDARGTINIYEVDNNSPYAQCAIASWNDDAVKCDLPSTIHNGQEYYFEIVTADNRKSSKYFYRAGK
jgi:hypothetical protein